MRRFKFPKLSHPWAKSKAGFTLVELIVVIAILGVLAGVGTVGYSGYIKSANKKADLTLVGNIMRAVETGTNSAMFPAEESISIAATKYPVAFIALTDGSDGKPGFQVYTSSSEYKHADGAKDPCQFENITVYYPKSTSQPCSNSECNKSETVYARESYIGYVCLTHSKEVKYNSGEDEIEFDPVKVKEYTMNCSGAGCEVSHNAPTPKSNLTVPGKSYYSTTKEAIFTKSTDGVLCEYAYKNQTGQFVAPDGTTSSLKAVGVGDPIVDSINIAFGSTSDLKLKYGAWGEDAEDEVGYATLYTYASDMFTKVNDVAGLLVDLQGIKNYVPSLGAYFSDDYDDKADLVSTYSDVISNISPETWDGYWAEAARNSDEYDFRIGNHGGKNDFIWASRLAYNSGFASYCSAHGVTSEYVELITNYGANAYSEISTKAGALKDTAEWFLNKFVPEHKNTNIPSVANADAFNKTGTGSLKEMFEKAGEDGAEMFKKCDDLYEQYKVSDVCKENGRVFYSTMCTINETSDAVSAKNPTDEAFVAHYKNYLDEMKKVYDAAKTNSADGIMIIVSVDNGAITCQVSPASANPRSGK